MIGTKWKPHEAVEFKHVVEFSERVGRMSDDSLLLGRVWNEMQSTKGEAKQLRKGDAEIRELCGPPGEGSTLELVRSAFIGYRSLIEEFECRVKQLKSETSRTDKP